MNAWVRQFLRAVRAEIPVSGPQERQFLRELRAQLEDTFAHRPPASVEEVSAQVGTPEEVVGNYLFHLDPEDLAGRIRRAKRWRRTAVCMVLAAFLISCICAYAIFQNYAGYSTRVREGTGYYIDHIE